jgi:O-antigen/teichoic acid export membrane protein
MSDSLKKNTISSFIWNMTDKVGFQVVALFVGIFTARMLSPRDFGLMGALSIFTLLSTILVESGFTSAMVRRKENKKSEYSAIFFINLALSLFFYFALFLCAPLIADYFEMPELCTLSRYLFLSIIINSCGIVPNILLTISLSFKQISIASISSAVVSAVVTISLVFLGYGYWALVWQLVIQNFVRSGLLWIFSRWGISKPDFSIVREVFSFSAFVLLTFVLNAIVKNVYNVIIGRRYTAEDLGYYYQANKFQSIPSSVIGTTISGVSYPVLSQLNNEEERQLVYFRKIIRVTAFLIFPVMIILFSMLENLVAIILTDKWLPAVPYFKILAVSAIIFPFHSLNLNVLAVKGYAKIYFWLELFRNALCIIFLLLAFLFLSLVPSSDDPSFAIKVILIGYSFASFISYIADSIYVQKKMAYKVLQQAKDILPYAAISGIMFLVVKCVGLLSFGLYTTTVLQIVAAACFYFISLKILGSKVLEDVLEIWKKRN